MLLVDDKGRVRIRRIRLGSMIKNEWEVLSGLSEGERIVIEGILKVRPGEVVDFKR